MQESSGFITTFVFALVIIFLALAALFESFRDPLIILVSVPMSIAGALVFINLGIGGATIEDDQLPWVDLSVPVLHLIPSPFPITWHAAQDDGASVDYALVYYLVEALWAVIH